MGLFHLFKKNTSDVSDEPKSTEHGDEKLEEFIEALKSSTLKDSIEIAFNPKEDVGLTESKIGGYPYIAVDASVPKAKDGSDLFCLAQINCEELPKNDIYPAKGLLQFWIGRDEVYGLEFGKHVDGIAHKVVYYETVDDSVTVEDVKSKYSLTGEAVNYSMLIYEKPDVSRALSFNLVQQAITTSAREWKKTFVEKYNEFYPENQIASFYDLPDEVNELIWDSLYASGHRIGGYPTFCQSDPRKDSEYSVLLLQIDTDDDLDIMWGDSGVGNFFITPPQLENRDFSKVFYTWDCC